jgi:predicted DNA-binding transcriptional regulator YafY
MMKHALTHLAGSSRLHEQRSRTTAWRELRAAFRFFRTDRIGRPELTVTRHGVATLRDFQIELRADPLHRNTPDRK